MIHKNRANRSRSREREMIGMAIVGFQKVTGRLQSKRQKRDGRGGKNGTGYDYMDGYDSTMSASSHKNWNKTNLVNLHLYHTIPYIWKTIGKSSRASGKGSDSFKSGCRSFDL